LLVEQVVNAETQLDLVDGNASLQVVVGHSADGELAAWAAGRQAEIGTGAVRFGAADGEAINETHGPRHVEDVLAPAQVGQRAPLAVVAEPAVGRRQEGTCVFLLL